MKSNSFAFLAIFAIISSPLFASAGCTINGEERFDLGMSVLPCKKGAQSFKAAYVGNSFSRTDGLETGVICRFQCTLTQAFEAPSGGSSDGGGAYPGINGECQGERFKTVEKVLTEITCPGQMQTIPYEVTRYTRFVNDPDAQKSPSAFCMEQGATDAAALCAKDAPALIATQVSRCCGAEMDSPSFPMPMPMPTPVPAPTPPMAPMIPVPASPPAAMPLAPPAAYVPPIPTGTSPLPAPRMYMTP